MTESGGRALYRAADPDRDQSYFLFATTCEQLKVLRFPLGGLMKSEVRALAREFSLVVADKADSQDICFVPAGHYSDMIERLRPGAAEPGEIVHIDGRVLGRHHGILHYTIGQRRGIGIATGEPLYVVKLDAERARVIVGPRRHLATQRVKLRDFNWIGPAAVRAIGDGGLAVAARVRSTRPPAAARLYADASVAFEEPEFGGVAWPSLCDLQLDRRRRPRPWRRVHHWRAKLPELWRVANSSWPPTTKTLCSAPPRQNPRPMSSASRSTPFRRPISPSASKR